LAFNTADAIVLFSRISSFTPIIAQI